MRLGGRGAMKPSISPACEQGGNRHAFRRVVEAHAGGQLDGEFFRPARLRDAAADPVDVGGRHPVIVIEEGARPDIGRELIFRHADFLALEVRRLLDAIGADIDRVMAEGAGDEGRHRDVGTVTLRHLDRIARERQFADVEFGGAEGAKENLLRDQRHIDRVDAVDGDAAVDQRPGPVVLADGDREIEFGHSNFFQGAVRGST